MCSKEGTVKDGLSVKQQLLRVRQTLNRRLTVMVPAPLLLAHSQLPVMVMRIPFGEWVR